MKGKGYKPFFVSLAGCCLEGAYAIVEAFNELHDQMLLLGHLSYDIVLAVGTGNTYSGLWCGAKCSDTTLIQARLLVDLLKKRKLGDRPIVFWHTGGMSGAIDVLINS